MSFLRTVCPELSAEFAADHDRNVWRCMAEILRVGHVERSSISSSSLPLTLGGVGVGGALRIRDAAHWGSWRIVWRWCGQGILKWLRTSLEEYKEEFPTVCPQSRIARRWSAVANMGSIGRRGLTSNKFGRGEGTF